MKKPIIDDLEKIYFAIRPIMRYETVGDWQDSGRIEVYKHMTPQEQLAVGIHELVEMVLLHAKGISQKEVDEWDTGDSRGSYDTNMYQKNQEYHDAHEFAETVERKIIEAFGISWEDYSASFDKMDVAWNKEHFKT